VDLVNRKGLAGFDDADQFIPGARAFNVRFRQLGLPGGLVPQIAQQIKDRKLTLVGTRLSRAYLLAQGIQQFLETIAYLHSITCRCVISLRRFGFFQGLHHR